jgi:hypothetical protein
MNRNEKILTTHYIVISVKYFTEMMPILKFGTGPQILPAHTTLADNKQKGLAPPRSASWRVSIALQCLLPTGPARHCPTKSP